MSRRDDVASSVAAALEKLGVERVFGVPGRESESLLFALERVGVTFVPTRHALGAAFMAKVWGQVTGRVGVCLASGASGAAGVLPGIADATADGAPMLVITGDHAGASGDSERILSAATKWGATVSADDATATIRNAVRCAERERMGAVHVALPERVAREGSTREPATFASPPSHPPAPAAASVDAALDTLRSAKRPLLLAGRGASDPLAAEALSRLVSDHDLPVTTTFMGKGSVSDRMKQSLRTAVTPHASEAIGAADVMVTVGYEPWELPPERMGLDDSERIVHLATAPAEVGGAYDPEVEVVGDLARGLAAIHQGLDDHPLEAEPDWWGPMRAAFDEDVRETRLPADDEWGPANVMTVPGSLHLLRHVLPDAGVVVSDVGCHQAWLGRNFPAYAPRSVISSWRMSNMGIGIPGAIAASLAAPDRPVVATVGDGGALVTIQELETAVRLGAAFVVLVFHDDDYGAVSAHQRRRRGRSVGTRVGNPDFVALSESFGIRAVRARTPNELDSNLSEALIRRALRVIEVPVSGKANDALELERLPMSSALA